MMISSSLNQDSGFPDKIENPKITFEVPIDGILRYQNYFP